MFPCNSPHVYATYCKYSLVTQTMEATPAETNTQWKYWKIAYIKTSWTLPEEYVYDWKQQQKIKSSRNERLLVIDPGKIQVKMSKAAFISSLWSLTKTEKSKPLYTLPLHTTLMKTIPREAAKSLVERAPKCEEVLVTLVNITDNNAK